MTETWAVGYTARDFSAPEIHIDDKGHIETKFEYAYYKDFNEAKNAMLGILGASGLDMIANHIDSHAIVALAQATVEFMEMTEEEFKSDRADEPMIADIMGVMGFFLLNREVKSDEAKISGMTFELVADHRNCTKDFCYGEHGKQLNDLN